MVPIPQVPLTQAKRESENNGWKVPPLDGSLNLSQMLKFNYTNNGEKPLFVYSDSDGSLQHISWYRAVNATYRVAAALSHVRSPQCVIAIFSSMDTITYWAYIHGILAAGHRPFPIAPEDSAHILPQLLKASSASYIIIDAEGPFREVAKSALDILTQESGLVIDVLITQSFGWIFNDEHPSPVVESSSLDLDSQAMILHSSGT
jgi:acyl-CoA synthetase (AMP-forming)/AMP-acid ligase II